MTKHNAHTIVFRADASLTIGTGHVMRCLTLANALKAMDNECHFICRNYRGALTEKILMAGHSVHPLNQPPPNPIATLDNQQTVDVTTQTLPCLKDSINQQQDAAESGNILQTLKPKWLVVDHYQLDIRWELLIEPYHEKLLVIDDLANRQHIGDILLDQNLGRTKDDYSTLLPTTTELLIGPKYALLRPEFAELREFSRQRRQQPSYQRLLISMGGYDQANATVKVLKAIRQCILPTDISIAVIMGDKAPWQRQVKDALNELPWQTTLLINPDNMGHLLATSDIAIGAAGSSSWERCCLGLPTLSVITADNQREAALALHNAGAHTLVGVIEDIPTKLPALLGELTDPQTLSHQSNQAYNVCDGSGATAIANILK